MSLKNDKLDMKTIGEYCAVFRKYKLRYSQKDFANIIGTSAKNVCSFEHGKSTNLNFVYQYWKLCENEEQRREFLANLFIE